MVIRHTEQFHVLSTLARENIRFSSLFVAVDVLRNVPSGEERGETDVFAGYINTVVIQRSLTNIT